MADRPLPAPLPADLPEDWTSGQIVAPDGADVGLSEQHGYNYQSKQINAAQRAVNQIREVLETGDIENTVTVEGGGHMEMGESLGGPPYTITVTEETDAPLTAEDVGAIPLPDDPVKGQALIFDGSKWAPGDVQQDTKIADYISYGTVRGSFSAGETTKEIYFSELVGGIKPLITFRIHTMNSNSSSSTEFKWEIVKSGTASVLHQQDVPANQGATGIFAAAIANAPGMMMEMLGGWSGMGDRLRLSSGAGGGSYEVTAVGFGPML